VVKLLRENFPMFFSQIFVSLQMYAPIMLIGVFGNNLMAGQYKIVEQIIVIFKTYIYLFFNFVYPRVCFLWQQSIKEALKFWKTFNGLNFIFIAFSMAVIYLFSEWCVSYFTKTNIVEISDLLQIAVLIPLLLAISIPLKQLLLGDNQQKLYVRITMVMVIVNLLTMVLLLPKYQIKGVLLTLIVTEVVTIAVYFCNLKSKINA
jgi:O-antigen/teichoic acid export membrane protein